MAARRPEIPNAETRRALQDAEDGKLARHESVDALFAGLSLPAPKTDSDKLKAAFEAIGVVYETALTTVTLDIDNPYGGDQARNLVCFFFGADGRYKGCKVY